MLKSKPSKSVEQLVRAHVMKLPNKVSKDFRAGNLPENIEAIWIENGIAGKVRSVA